MSKAAKLTGVVRDGVVVPDEPLNLPDGTPVYIELGSIAGLLSVIGVWKDNPIAEDLLAEIRARRLPQEDDNE